jgi:hypothetical protein
MKHLICGIVTVIGDQHSDITDTDRSADVSNDENIIDPRYATSSIVAAKALWKRNVFGRENAQSAERLNHAEQF